MKYRLIIADEVKESLNLIDDLAVNAFMKKISDVSEDSKSIFLAGAGRSLLMIRTFAMRLMHLGYTAYVVGDTSTPAIKEGDLLIIGSGSGETKALKLIADTAKNKNAELLLVTRNKESYIATASDIVIEVPIIKSIQPSGSIFEQSMFLLFDSMVLELMNMDNLGEGQNIDDFINVRHANLE